MFVTTARTGLDKATLDGAPLSGGLLAFRPGVTGVEEPAFGVCPAQADGH
jgi:sugar lactone lactonase YvrE